MKQEFNFEQVGKRLPYTVPEDFFSQMEKDLMKKVKKENNHKRKRIIRLSVMLTAVSIAAATFLFVFNADLHKEAKPVNELARVDKAFSNLNADDQAYLLDVYQNDIFLNEN